MEKGNFSGLKYSVHIFDKNCNRLADIDKNGVSVYGDELNIAVCKEVGEEDGWTESETVYVSDGLKELFKQKK